MKHIITSTLLFLVTFMAYGQESPLPTNIQSPTAASLGKYGDLPVSFYTGAANISIPLTSLKVNNIPLNIGLNYDASGVRPNSHPGWVGQNWSLSAGGVITRSVNGFADEYGNSITYRRSYMEMASTSQLNKYDPNSEAGLKVIAEARLDFGPDGLYATDLEPDIFTFNFMGISGKFFLDANNHWRVISDQNLIVVHDPTDANNYTLPFIEDVPGRADKFDFVIYGFKLKDDQGNTYTFGYNQDAIEYSIPFFNQVYYSPYQYSPGEISQWVANSWYLTKVTDKYGNDVYNFEYERGYYIGQFFKAGQATSSTAHVWAGWNFNKTNTITSSNSMILKTGGALISPVYLKQISSYANDIISFNKSVSTELEYEHDSDFQSSLAAVRDVFQSAGGGSTYPLAFLEPENQYTYTSVSNEPLRSLRWFKLDNITVSNRQDVKHFNLTYTNSSTERLKLEKIDVNGKINTTTNSTQSYLFNYDRFEELPPYLSKKVDHWGYFKEFEYTKFLSVASGAGHYATRQPDNDFMKKGSLIEITYPTGGKSVLEYEPHTYAKIVKDDRSGLNNETGIASGIRIKKITNFNGSKVTSTKEYKYVTNYQTGGTGSSGILNAKPKYYWDDWKTTTSYGIPYSEDVYSINSLIPLSNSFGSHIGYSEVAEVGEDGSYTIYKYTSNLSLRDEQPTGRLNIDSSPYMKFNDKSHMRGKLLETLVYNNQNEIQQKIKNIYRTGTTMYDEFSFATDAIWGYASLPSNAQIYYKGSGYKVYYFDYDTKEEVTSYLSTGNIITTKNIVRSSVDVNSGEGTIRLTKQVDTNIGTNVETKTYYYYPFDVSSRSYMSNLVGDYRFGELIDTKILKNGTAAGYRSMAYKLEEGKYLPSILSISGTDQVSLVAKTYFDDYDSVGNLLQYHNANDSYNSFIWGYNRQHLIASIKNATMAQVGPHIGSAITTSNTENSTAGESSIRTSLNSIRTSLPNAQVTSYTYDPLIGLTSQTDPNGYTMFYEYDEANRLKNVKDSDGDMISESDYNYRGAYESLDATFSTQSTGYLGRYIAGSSVIFSLDNDKTNIGSSLYRYEFGDGAASTGGPNSTHAFATGGDKTVKLIITNPEYIAQEFTKTVTVYECSPGVNICGPYLYNPCTNYDSGSCVPHDGFDNISFKTTTAIGPSEVVTYQWSYQYSRGGSLYGWYNFGSNSSSAELSEGKFSNTTVSPPYVADYVNVRCTITDYCGNVSTSGTKKVTINYYGSCN